MLAEDLAALYARDLVRLTQQLQAFPDTPSLWAPRPGIVNAAGTLALHLEGNLREFVGRLLGGIAYERDRSLEFSARGVEQSELIARIEAVHAMVPRVLARLSAERLDAMYPVPYGDQPITTRQLLIHLSGHLNYHLGQIDYLRRVITGSGAINLAQL